MKQVFAILALAAALTQAQTTTPATTHTQAEIDAHRAKVEQALEARDYTAWKTEHDAFSNGNSRMDGKITEANFDKFADMHAARKAGDYEKAQALRTELGIEGGKGQGMGKGQGKGGSGACMKGSGTGSGKGQGQGKGQGKRGNCTK